MDWLLIRSDFKAKACFETALQWAGLVSEDKRVRCLWTRAIKRRSSSIQLAEEDLDKGQRNSGKTMAIVWVGKDQERARKRVSTTLLPPKQQPEERTIQEEMKVKTNINRCDGKQQED
ncbi:uncharacterized protein LOC143161370 [Aptenodytes patagonicus]|uniref:uncharacterized protein LOC143161370 n=1 Tax=Aptenodytes patagonicus TaxID=9234 RepID=UPI003F9F92D4